MILPHTNVSILILMAISLLCGGSWAITLKLAGKWRYELYFFDFAFGMALLALVLGFTVGNLGYDGFGLMDSLMNAGKQQWLFAFGAGVVFTVGNTILLAVISEAGLMLAFPAALGTALIFDAIARAIGAPVGNPVLLGTGCVLVACAIVAAALAHQTLSRRRYEALARAGLVKTTRRPDFIKDVVLAVVGGLFLGGSPLLLQRGTVAEIGLGPYSVWLFFGLGVLATTLAVGMFLLNLSVQGEELSIPAFINSTPKQHLLGLAGGGLWLTGALAAAVAVYANTAPGVNGGLPAGSTPVAAAPIYVLTQAVALLAALWGLLAWKEGKGGDLTTQMASGLMLILYAGGIALVALSMAVK